MVSKVYRDDVLKKPVCRHHCQASMITEGLGYNDLNKLFQNPQDLEFIFGKEAYFYLYFLKY